jgi:hypothetical protein
VRAAGDAAPAAQTTRLNLRAADRLRGPGSISNGAHPAATTDEDSAIGGETISERPTILQNRAYLLPVDVSGRGRNDNARLDRLRRTVLDAAKGIG